MGKMLINTVRSEQLMAGMVQDTGDLPVFVSRQAGVHEIYNSPVLGEKITQPIQQGDGCGMNGIGGLKIFKAPG